MKEVWYDTRVGEMLLGEAAYASRLEGSAPGEIVSLAQLVLNSGGAAEIERAPSTDEATRKDYIEHGQWLLHLLQTETQNDSFILERSHLERMEDTGIGPPFRERRTFVRHFKTMYNYRLAIDAPVGRTQGRYASWSTTQFVTYAQEIATSLGKKPTTEDYDRASKSGRGPSTKVIRATFGDISDLNELIGYPRIKGWSAEEYIDWGVRAYRANPESGVTRRLLDTLSKQKRGPSSKAIFSTFGALSTYQSLIKSESERRQRAQEETTRAKLERYHKMLDNKELGQQPVGISRQDLLELGAKRILINRCAPHVAENTKLSIVRLPTDRFTKRLLKTSAWITPGIIELEAITAEVHDDLWPSVDEEYLRAS